MSELHEDEVARRIVSQMGQRPEVGDTVSRRLYEARSNALGHKRQEANTAWIGPRLLAIKGVSRTMIVIAIAALLRALAVTYDSEMSLDQDWGYGSWVEQDNSIVIPDTE